MKTLSIFGLTHESWVMIRVMLAPNDLWTPFDPRAQNFRVNVELSVHYCGQKSPWFRAWHPSFKLFNIHWTPCSTYITFIRRWQHCAPQHSDLIAYPKITIAIITIKKAIIIGSIMKLSGVKNVTYFQLFSITQVDNCLFLKSIRVFYDHRSCFSFPCSVFTTNNKILSIKVLYLTPVHTPTVTLRTDIQSPGLGLGKGSRL